MSNKIYIIITLFVGCFFYGQNIIVKDSLSHIPLDAVLIKSISGNKLASTNHLGQATLPKNMGDSIRLQADKYLSKKVSTKDFSKDQTNIIYLKSKAFHLNSIITTGTNWKNNPEKSTVSISSLSKDEVQRLNQPTTADLVGRTNEVYIQKSQLGGGSPMIRGFATNRLLISVDGVTMNNAIFRSGNLQNIIAIDPFSIQNVEVIAGPASVLYGSDAIGGVMSFETKSPLPTPEPKIMAEATARYASAANEKTLHVDAEFSMPKFASFSSFTYTHFDDLRMGKHGPKDYLRPHYVDRINGEDVMLNNEDPHIQKYTGYSQKNFLQKFRYHPSGNLHLTASFSFSETSDVPRYDRLLRYKNNRLKSAEWYYGPQQWILSKFQSTYHHKHSFFDEFNVILSHQYFTESRHDRDFGSDLRNNRYERVNVWGWENVFKKQLSDKNTLFYGTDIKLNHVNSAANLQNIATEELSNAATRYPDGANWNQYGIYTKLQSKISHRLNFISGLRYAYVQSKAKFNQDFYPLPFEEADIQTGALTGKVGIYYKPFRQWVFNSQFSTGFRAPNIDDLGKVFDSEPGSVIVPNPNLKPEYIYNIEAGISKSFGNTLFLSATGYYSWLKDALVRRDFSLNGNSTMLYDGEMSQIQAIQNASEARVYGGLFQLELNLHRSLKLLGKVNYTHGVEELDDGTLAPMRHAAPLFGQLALEYKKNKLSAQLSYQFNGEINADDLPPNERKKTYLYALDANGQAYAPAWNIFNFSAQYQWADFMVLQAGVDNIFDHLYRSYASGISAPGRNFVISVRTIF